MIEAVVSRDLLIGCANRLNPPVHPGRWNFLQPWGNRIIAPVDSLLPLCVTLPSTAIPDLVIWVVGEEEPLFRLTPSQYTYSLAKMGDSYRLLTTGEVAGCIYLDECVDYQLQVGSFYSGVFTTQYDLSELVKITLASTKDVGRIPYSLGWSQWAWLNAEVGEVTPELFQLSKRDERGRLTVSYSRLTDTVDLTIPDATADLRYSLSRLPLLTAPVFEANGLRYAIDVTSIKAKSDDELLGLATYTLSVSLLSEVETTCAGNAASVIGSFSVPVVDCPPPNGVDAVTVDCQDPYTLDADCVVPSDDQIDQSVIFQVVTEADAALIYPELPNAPLPNQPFFIAHN